VKKELFKDSRRCWKKIDGKITGGGEHIGLKILGQVINTIIK
jgi:hypothetical protein